MKIHILHKWKLVYNSGFDPFPPPFVLYKNPRRECSKCGKMQQWLPGYGGSEIGCWVKQ